MGPRCAASKPVTTSTVQVAGLVRVSEAVLEGVAEVMVSPAPVVVAVLALA